MKIQNFYQRTNFNKQLKAKKSKCYILKWFKNINNKSISKLISLKKRIFVNKLYIEKSHKRREKKDLTK